MVDDRVEPVLDEATIARLRALQEISGDQGFLAAVIDAYLEELPRLLGRLQQALVDGDLHGVEHEAHTLKGSSATIGAVGMASLAGQLESAARDGALARVHELMDGVGPACDSARRALKAL